MLTHSQPPWVLPPHPASGFQLNTCSYKHDFSSFCTLPAWPSPLKPLYICIHFLFLIPTHWGKVREQDWEKINHWERRKHSCRYLEESALFETAETLPATKECQKSCSPADGDCSHEIKRHLFLGRKAMTNLDSILKSRDITLPTNIHLVKAMVFPVVVYGYEKGIMKKAEHQRTDAFKLWWWRGLCSESLGLQGDRTSQS